jgi:hypothetical protein
MRNKMFMVSAGSAALILSGAVMAAPPIPFDGWTLNADKSITGGACSLPDSCTTTMAGDYFLQRNVTVGGVQYIQTIVTDATGFKDENFVRMAGGAGVTGIAGKQNITETSTVVGPPPVTTVFSSTAELQTGWAAPAEGNLVKLTQSLDQAALKFTSNFGFSQTTDNAGVIKGKSLDLGQNVSVAQAGVPGGENDKQLFVLRERQGTFNPAAGTFQLQGGTPLSYVALDDVKVTWIGQGITMGSGLGAQDFGFQSYANLTSPGAVQKFDLASMGTFDDASQPWKTALFGAKPVYATPPIFNP